MQAAARLLLLALALALAARGSEGEAQPSIKCGVENGPSPELMEAHQYTPSDLFNLNAEIVEVQGMCQFNITWTLKEDASIIYLNATKVCVSWAGGVQDCIRCDYTGQFKNQTTTDGLKWQFHYVGFRVDENKDYFIQAYNLPPPDPNQDYPERKIKLTSPDCQDDILKHCKTCIEMGSSWEPNISACYTESEVELNFTASRFSSQYFFYLYESDDYGDPIEHTVNTAKRNDDTRVFERIPVKGRSPRTYIELIPSFQHCGNDCLRYRNYPDMCEKKTGSGEKKPGNGSVVTNSLATYVCTSAALLLIVCVLTALYFKRRRDTANKWVFLYPTTKQIPTTVLIVYSQEVCFQHTVLGFAEFLHKRCQSDVIIDAWQRRKIAEIGPVQWLATQRETADKIIFLSAGASAACDSACKRIVEGQKDSECMFTLAFNLFCSDLKNQSSLHKYMVVSFNETNLAMSLPSPLNSCPKYFLMKDIHSFCRDLYLSQNPRSDEGTTLKVLLDI